MKGEIREDCGRANVRTDCGGGTDCTDCGGGFAAGATHSGDAVAGCLAGARLEIGAAHSGAWTGSWRSRFPVARLFYVLSTGTEAGMLADSETQVPLRPGQWALLPPGREIRHVQPAGIDVVSVHFRLATRGGADPLGDCGLCGGGAPGWRDAFLALEDRLARGGAPSPALSCRIQGIVWEALAALAGRDGEAIAGRIAGAEAFAPLLEAVDAAPGRDFTVAEMARVMGMDESAFAKKFTAAMGQAPRRWFNGRRARGAALALLSGMTSAAVAEKFGFCDEYYFSRFFKRHFGQSPANWRRRANA